MLKYYSTPNGAELFVETDSKVAVAVVDITPEAYATLVEVPYPSDTSNYVEVALDAFAATPLKNIIVTSKSPLQILAAKYLLSQIPLL